MLNVSDEPPKETSAEDELKDLDQRLKAIDARKGRTSVDAGSEVGASQGYQVLGELIGGILGGLGLGWLVDQWLHSTPWGMVAGTLLGMVLAIYLVVKRSQSQN